MNPVKPPNLLINGVGDRSATSII